MPKKRKPAPRKSTRYSPPFNSLRSGLHAFVLSFSIGLAAIGCSNSLQPQRPDSTATVGDASRQQNPGGFSSCPQHFPAQPTAVAGPGLQGELCFDAFAVLYSGQSKTPVYSVEHLTRANLASAQGIKRSDRFYPEARLPAAYRAQLADYAGSGYDRGHMAPAGDMPTVDAKAQSFSLANMVPQVPELNQKAWNQIEQATRKYVGRAQGDVYVFTGPSFGPTPATIGPGKVWVPTAIWKLVHVPAERRSWAYWMSNNAGPHSLKPIEYAEFLRLGGPQVLVPAEH